MKQSIVMVVSYGGPYGGNFIPSLIAYDEIVKELRFRSVYIFPDFVSDFPWVEEMRHVADKLYFIPYNQYSIDNIMRIREICKGENAVLIYSRMTGWDITARLAMPRLPLIWHMEMGLSLDNWKRKLKYWVKYRILGFGKTYHIAVSDKTAGTINSLHVRNHCKWIPNAINLTRLHERKAYSFGEPVKLLTFAYQPIIKGFDLALDACEILNVESVRFTLMASAQKHTKEYVMNRYGNDTPKWLILLEPTDNIASVFDEADIMLSPSRSEGFPFSVAEALYSGLPVVYSDIPGTRWADEMKMTYQFRSEDSQCLVDAIQYCVNEPVTAEGQLFNRAIIINKYTMLAWQNRIRDALCQYLPKED